MQFLKVAMAESVNKDTFHMPKYATDGSAGLDLYAQEDITVYRDEVLLVKLGFHTEIEPGFAAMLLPRSGLGTKHGLFLANTTGLIDSDYRGEWMCCVGLKGGLYDSEDITIKKGDHFAQAVFFKHEKPVLELVGLDKLTETVRGEGGFGHTSVNVEHSL